MGTPCTADLYPPPPTGDGGDSETELGLVLAPFVDAVSDQSLISHYLRITKVARMTPRVDVRPRKPPLPAASLSAAATDSYGDALSLTKSAIYSRTYRASQAMNKFARRLECCEALDGPVTVVADEDNLRRVKLPRVDAPDYTHWEPFYQLGYAEVLRLGPEIAYLQHSTRIH
jgi:hypothetical protein